MLYELSKCGALFQKLKQLGPLKEGDQRLVVNLSQEGRRLVMDKKGMINFLKSDERFGSYADYVCLKGEAERAKQLHENEVNTQKCPAHHLRSTMYISG